MKPSIFLSKLMALLAIFALLLGPASAAYAQDGSGDGGIPPGWSEFVNADGSIDFDALSDPVQVSVPADWMSFPSPVGNIPVGMPPGNATYLQYITPSGAVLVVPSPATMLMTYLNADASGWNANTPSQMGNGFSTVAQLLSGVFSPEDIASMGYASPEDFFTSLANGQIDSGTFTALFTDWGRMANFLSSLTTMGFDLGSLVNALWLYQAGLDCAIIPGGCPPGYGQPGSDPNNPGGRACLPATVQQAEFSAAVQKLAPNYPLVVGQDKDKRGVDIQITVSNPPVIFTWYEAVEEGGTCAYTPAGDGGGCPGPAEAYDSVTDAGGNETSWSSSMAGNRFWSAGEGQVECIQHVETLPDPIVQLTAYAQLSPASKAWILGDLAEKYYGASIHQERFDLVPAMAEPTLGCDASGLCTATALVSAIPFADPGQWLVDVKGATAGASFLGVPITQPRSLFLQAPQQIDVYVLLESLVTP
ncbi:MAG: hypothetical protein ACOYYS_17700 [Chloroflexota bacterium]